VSDLEKRLETLERSAGGACPKCSGVLVTVVNGKMRSATRCGEPIGPAARAEFEASGSRCSACGAGFLEIRVPPEIPGRQPGEPRSDDMTQAWTAKRDLAVLAYSLHGAAACAGSGSG
jgi:DNA-directed RNA polymerase subunit RPC12/RpoP